MELELGDEIKKERANWDFSGKNTAEHFDDHISKSIMLYEQGHELICYLSDYFCNKDSVCYDLGCSTGALLKKLAEYNNQKSDIKWIGIDNEKDMIDKARLITKDISNICFEIEDIVDCNLEKSDFIVSYYTMQFIKPRDREKVLKKIYDSLNVGGAFLMFEKVQASEGNLQDIMSSLYIEYKLKNGFNSDEIISKSRSIKSVLNPFSSEKNISLLKEAGFKDVISVMKYVCFEGFLAIK